MQEWLQISSGGDHACAIDPAGALWCWGANETGQLGNGGTESSPTPVAVTGISEAVVEVTTGWKHTCAITTSGQAWCWGNNDLGQLGNNDSEPTANPVMVMNLADAKAIAAGDAHTCALRTDGTAWCWGLNADGQLGDGSGNFLDFIVPHQVAGVTGASSICSSFVHSCVTSSSGVYCWGENLSKQLGPNGGDADSLDTPVEVPGANLGGASMVACGDGHVCAVAGGQVVCWGENSKGQLGDGMMEETPTPTTVAGISGALAVAASIDHTCAITDSEVYCWGSNGFTDFMMGGAFSVNGKIARPASVESAAEPQLVTGVTAPITISTGDNASCVSTDGHAFCWGANDDGELGNGGTDSAFAPVAVVAPTQP